MSFVKSSFPSQELRDLNAGQVSETFSSAQWQELKPRAQKLASHVSLQFLLENGKKVTTEGNLYLYKTTYLTPEKKDKKDKKDKSAENDKQNPTSKLEMYIQRIVNSNQMIAFEIEVPLRQDITRFCSRKRLANIRESGIKSNPVLVLMMCYLVFLNLMQYLPSLGFEINLSNPIIVAINAVAITSIFWFAYLEFKLSGYWCTLNELTKTRLVIALDIKEQVAGRTMRSIKVRRTLTVFRVQVFYSETMHTEALQYNPEMITSAINKENIKKIQNYESEKLTMTSEVEQLKTELNQAHTALEGSENRIRKAERYGFIRRGHFEGQSLFEEKPPLTSFMESGSLKWIILGIASIVCSYFVFPMLMELTIELPEISASWQVLIALSLILGIVFLVVSLYTFMRKIA